MIHNKWTLGIVSLYVSLVCFDPKRHFSLSCPAAERARFDDMNMHEGQKLRLTFFELTQMMYLMEMLLEKFCSSMGWENIY